MYNLGKSDASNLEMLGIIQEIELNLLKSLKGKGLLKLEGDDCA